MANVDAWGINEGGLKQMALDIYDYAEKINTIFNSIDDAINEASQHLVVNNTEILQKKFLLAKNNFTYIRDNILSYADEFLRVEASYQGINQDLTGVINKATQTVDDDNKYVEKEE